MGKERNSHKKELAISLNQPPVVQNQAVSGLHFGVPVAVTNCMSQCQGYLEAAETGE